MDEILKCAHSNETATEQNFLLHVRLFAVQLGSSLKCVDEILECDHSNESYCRSSTFMCFFFIMLYKVVLTFESLDEILKCDPFK